MTDWNWMKLRQVQKLYKFKLKEKKNSKNRIRFWSWDGKFLKNNALTYEL